MAHRHWHPWEKAGPKARGRRSETSEAVTGRWRPETAELGGRAGPLRHPGAARGSGTRPARQGHPQLMDRSRPRQRQLDQAAKRRRQRRCPARYDRLCRPEMLGRAWRAVRAHGGRAGGDGVWRADVAPQGVAACLQALAHDLRAGRDRSPPVRRVEMPKPDGRPSPRGMPTGRDRVGPQAGQLVIAPIVEAHFPHTSDGVRPQRRATHAGQVVTAQLVSTGSVVDVASERGLDTIDQARRRPCGARRLSDRRGLTRLRQGVTAGVGEEGPWGPPTSGSPPGGVLSPGWATLS